MYFFLNLEVTIVSKGGFLNENKKYIFQKFISKAKINSKFTPKLSFYLDDTFDEAEKIEKLLLKKNVARDLDG